MYKILLANKKVGDSPEQGSKLPCTGWPGMDRSEAANSCASANLLQLSCQSDVLTLSNLLPPFLGNH